MVKNYVSDCKNCPWRWKNFDVLTDEQLDLVNQNRFEAKFKPGEIIFKQGSPTSNAIFLTHGMAKIYMEGFDGKDIILGIAKPTGLVVGPGSYVDNRHHYSFAALTEANACFVDMNIFKKLVLENSKFAEGVIVDLSTKALGTFYKLISLSQKKMHGRLAEGLLFLADKIFENQKFECLLTRQEMGDLTGMTKESVVRLLKEFNEEEIITLNGTSIKLNNRKKLEKISLSG